MHVGLGFRGAPVQGFSRRHKVVCKMVGCYSHGYRQVEGRRLPEQYTLAMDERRSMSACMCDSHIVALLDLLEVVGQCPLLVLLLPLLTLSIAQDCDAAAAGHSK